MKAISIFCLTQLNGQNFFDIDDFKRLLKNKLGSDPFIMSCYGDADDEIISLIKQQAIDSDAIVFVMGIQQTSKYYYSLGLGDGILVRKSKPVLFLYTGKENTILNYCNRFVLCIGDLKDDLIKKAVIHYLKNDLENFWIHYAKSIVSKFNKKFSINLEIRENLSITNALSNVHPSDYTPYHLEIFLTRLATSNFDQFSDSFLKHQCSDSTLYYPDVYNTLKKGKPDPFRVFISYSKKDIDHKETLVDHLSGLRDSIVTWDDQNMLPGDEWDVKIKEELGKADIVIYLVTHNSMSTDYIQKIELPFIHNRCNNRECMLIPVIVDFCLWNDLEFAKFNALPNKGMPVTSKDWTNPNEAWLDVVKGIKKILTNFT